MKQPFLLRNCEHSLFSSLTISSICIAVTDRETELVIAFREGSLVVFDVVVDNDNNHFTCVPKRSVKNSSSSKTIEVTQMFAIHDLDLLICLFDHSHDGFIKILSLSELKELNILKNQKNQPLKKCKCMTLKKDHGEFVLAVAASNHSRVTIFRANSASCMFTYSTEIQMERVVKCVSWMREGILCIGSDTEYSLVKDFDLVQKRNEFNNPTLQKLSLTRPPQETACCVPLNGNNVYLLWNETFGIIVNSKGKPTCSKGVSWNSTPKSISFWKTNYLVASLGDVVEIRKLPCYDEDMERGADSLIQHLSIKDDIISTSSQHFLDLEKYVMDESQGYESYSFRGKDRLLFLASTHRVYVLVTNNDV
ncbi:hypothetical protein C9374_010746 [Naegleria lovaniensis]|uniref:CNH domain-containing protein n=1 Tax=Naegleria lovaniensis TaxID=51637 RepID=A0AA88GB62_NAELO|nr:uncharacterized protein C9374_010746 [Naegleria lovaniensis]KAG2374462.1 hypothetical protein C9374_010746 [Naegleria lovaniensis]